MASQKKGRYPSPVIFFFSAYLDLSYLFPNGTELDSARMDEMSLTDRQRDMAMRLSDKRRKLRDFHERIDGQAYSAESQQTRELDLNAFSDETLKPTGQNDHTRLVTSKKIEALEIELEELTSNLMVSLGLDPGDELRRMREQQRELFEMADETSGDVDDFFDISARTEYPEIPLVGVSENLESVDSKLMILANLRTKSESILSGHESEKRLNEIVNEDEEVDPLDAFMAENSVELASQQIGKESIKLEEIKKAISKFEKLKKVLAKNQFSDTRITEAIQQRARVEVEKRRVDNNTTSSSSLTERGTGTVWEEEFRKDESVPKRIASGERKEVVPIDKGKERLNLQLGGLQVMSGEDAVVWKQPDVGSFSSENRQEELRKRLGY